MADERERSSPLRVREGNALPLENIRKTRPKDLSRGPFAVAKRLVDTFSTVENRRPPPSPTKSRHVRLITIGPSNYCEKARWALDLLDEDPTSDVYYTEDAHPPAFASFATVPASDGEWSASPMIVFDDLPLTAKNEKKVIYDSSEIVQCLCPSLYPSKYSDDIIQFELYLGKQLGATTRCFLYHHLLVPMYFPLLAKIATPHSSRIEAALFERMLPKGLARGMRKAMTVNDESAAASLDSIRDVFREVSLRLNNGKREYLFGSPPEDSVGFTAADLTFASLAAPLVHPPELTEFYSEADVARLPPPLVDLRKELRSTAAGKHVLDMYKYHRFSIEKEKGTMKRIIIPKSMGRNRLPWTAGLCAGCAVTAIAYGANRFRRSRL